MKDMRWQEAKTIQEGKVFTKERRLMWDQEQKVMLCDVSMLDLEERNYVLAMRARIEFSH